MPELANPPISAAILLEFGTDRLRRAGLVDARREALRLWADLLGATPASALLRREDGVDEHIGAEFAVRVSRRAAGEPHAYVSGVAGFRRLVLACDRRALIPRPETEGLVDLLLEQVQTGTVADIGTGTGCLALSLAIEGRFGEVIAVDRSADALSLAQANVVSVRRTHAGAMAPVRLLRGDLSTSLRPAICDALVSNPPYLSEAEYMSVDPSVGRWEPGIALVSGADGLDATTKLLDDARRVLRADGWLAVELDSTRAAESARRAISLGWRDVAIHNDLFGRERYLLARRSEIS